MKKLLLLAIAGLINLFAYSQTSTQIFTWADNDKKYLIDNLTRSENELVKETENLSDEQWNFKESPDRWSIKEIVEHIGIWELIFQREISQAISAGVQPAMRKDAKPDSVYLGFIMEEHQHITTDYTKPFTFSVPMGLSDGKTNIARFLKMREESINYLRVVKDDLRDYYLPGGKSNVHQRFITTFGHTDRHLRQIKKVKSHPDYPKAK